MDTRNKGKLNDIPLKTLDAAPLITEYEEIEADEVIDLPSLNTISLKTKHEEIEDEETIDLPSDELASLSNENDFPYRFLEEILNTDFSELDDLVKAKPKLGFILDYIRDLPEMQNNKISQAGYMAFTDAPSFLFGMIFTLTYFGNIEGEPLIGKEFAINIIAIVLAALALIATGITAFSTYKILKDEDDENENTLKLIMLKNNVADEVTRRAADFYFKNVLQEISIPTSDLERCLAQCHTYNLKSSREYFTEYFKSQNDLVVFDEKNENKLSSEEKLRMIMEVIETHKIPKMSFKFVEAIKNKYSRIKESLSTTSNLSLSFLTFYYFALTLAKDFSVNDDVIDKFQGPIGLTVSTSLFLVVGGFFGYKANESLLNSEKVRQYREFLDHKWHRKIDKMNKNCELYNEKNPELTEKIWIDIPVKSKLSTNPSSLLHQMKNRPSRINKKAATASNNRRKTIGNL